MDANKLIKGRQYRMTNSTTGCAMFLFKRSGKFRFAAVVEGECVNWARFWMTEDKVETLLAEV